MQSDFDKDLLAYFTDVEHLRNAFSVSVAAPTLTKRLLVIHGAGGVGKSSLLRMFRLHAKRVQVPVVLASGDEAKSAFDVLARWTDDLKADGVALPSFGKMFERYRAIQAKVDEQAKKAAGGRAADIAGKAASKRRRRRAAHSLARLMRQPLGGFPSSRSLTTVSIGALY